MMRGDSLRAVRVWIGIFIAGLLVSGITAFPLETELRSLVVWMGNPALRSIATATHLLPWMARVHSALADTNARYPFLAYGTDWLAFAHVVIAVVFIGPYRDPVRNKWVVDFGLIACAGVIPLALIAGQVRGVPMAWRMIDCSFGVIGAVPLVVCRRMIVAMERAAGLGEVSDDGAHA